MLVPIMFWSIIAMLVAFVVVGLILTVRAMKTSRPGPQRLPMRERIRQYVGPVDPQKALLNPPLQVVVELYAALCGFPGLGWLISGRVFVGLVLISVVPAFVWALYPIYLCASGRIAASPYLVVDYLPVLSVISGTTLAIAQRASRKSGGRIEH